MACEEDGDMRPSTPLARLRRVRVDGLEYENYREYVNWHGQPFFERFGRHQLDVLVAHGLAREHRVLELGCGCLRAGKYLIHYLNPGMYLGVEPKKGILLRGIVHELTIPEFLRKRPSFSDVSDFSISRFALTFDFIFGYSVFTHASFVQTSACLREAYLCMHSKSKLIASFALGDSNTYQDKWVYPRCVQYTWQTIVELAERYGLRAVMDDQATSEAQAIQGEEQLPQTWVWFVRKP